MDGAEKKDVENCICSLLTSNPIRMTIQDLSKDYKKMIGTPVPFKKFGFNTLEDFLRSIPHRVQVIGSGNLAEVRVVVSQKTAHINNLICKQKVVKNKKNFRIGRRKYVPAACAPQQPYYQNEFSGYSNSGQTSTPTNVPRSVINKKICSDEDDDVLVPYVVRRKLKALVLNYSEGLLCSKIPELYSKKYKEKFNFHQYGYRSVAQLCLDMPSTFKYQHCENGDVRIFDSKISVPLSPILAPTPSPIDVASSEKKNTEPALPDDFDDILLGFHKAKLPENCILVENIERQWLSPTVQVLDYIDVNIAEVYDPSKFWLHLKEYSDELDEVMDDMQEFYRQNKAQYEVPFYALTKDMYVACVFNKEYHRAKILDCSKKMQSLLKMFFIDYGTVATVYTTGVCYLVPEFTTLPAQAIRARLHGIQPLVKDEFWPREAALRLLELVKRKEHLVAQIMWIDQKEQTLDIVLADTSIPDEDFYINDALVSENYAKFIDEIQNEPKEKNYIPSVQCVHLFPTHEELETGLAPSMHQMIILEQTSVTIDSIFPQYFSKKGESLLNKTDVLEEEVLNRENKTRAEKSGLESSSSPTSVKMNCSNPTSPETQPVSSSEVGMPRCPPGFHPLSYPTQHPTIFVPQVNMFDPHLYAIWANAQIYLNRNLILNPHHLPAPFNNVPPFNNYQYPPGRQHQNTTIYQSQDNFYRPFSFPGNPQPCFNPQYPPTNMGNFSGQQNFSPPFNMNMNFNFSRQVNSTNTADMTHDKNPNSPIHHKRITKNRESNTQCNLTNLGHQKNNAVGFKNVSPEKLNLKEETKISQDRIKRITPEKTKSEVKENLETESPVETIQSRTERYQFEPSKIPEDKIGSVSAEKIDAAAKPGIPENLLPNRKLCQNNMVIETIKNRIKYVSPEKIKAKAEIYNLDLPQEHAKQESPIKNESQTVIESGQVVKIKSNSEKSAKGCFVEQHLVEVKSIGGLDFHILNIHQKQFLVINEVMQNLFGASIPTHIIQRRFDSSPPFIDILRIMLHENFELAQELLRYNLIKKDSKTLEIVSIDDSTHIVTVLKAASDNKKCDAFLKSFKTAI